MASEPVNEQKILEELQRVPRDRWEEVVGFLRSLRVPVSAASDGKRSMTAADLLHSGLIGMWGRRADIGASRQFARRLREQAQTRSREP